MTEVSAKFLLEKLENYYKKKNPRIRRSIQRQQEERESFMNFYREKPKLFQIFDPCTHCFNQCLTDHVIEALYDPNLRKKCRSFNFNLLNI